MAIDQQIETAVGAVLLSGECDVPASKLRDLAKQLAAALESGVKASIRGDSDFEVQASALLNRLVAEHCIEGDYSGPGHPLEERIKSLEGLVMAASVGTSAQGGACSPPRTLGGVLRWLHAVVNDSKSIQDYRRNLVEVLDSAVAALGPTEREEELERLYHLRGKDIEDLVSEVDALRAKLAGCERARDEVEAQLRQAKHAIGARLEQETQHMDEFNQLRAKLAERELAIEPLSEALQSDVDNVLARYGEKAACHRVAVEMRKRFPKPAPIDPVQALIAEMRSEHGCGEPGCGSGVCFWARKLEVALLQK